MNAIFALLMNLAIVNAPYVDRVEDVTDTYSVAVVCYGFEGPCFDVPTTRNGLQEGDQGYRVCETHTRLDGTGAVVCGGSTVAFVRADGSYLANPYAAVVR